MRVAAGSLPGKGALGLQLGRSDRAGCVCVCEKLQGTADATQRRLAASGRLPEAGSAIHHTIVDVAQCGAVRGRVRRLAGRHCAQAAAREAMQYMYGPYSAVAFPRTVVRGEVSGGAPAWPASFKQGVGVG